VKIDIKVDGAKRALDQLLKDIIDATSRSMDEGLDAAEAMAKARIMAQTKSHTHRLLDGIQPVQLSATKGRLFALAPYSGFIDTGTKPHLIPVRKSKKSPKQSSRSFEKGGVRVFHHPGTAARPFVLPATVTGERVFHDNLLARVGNLAGSFNR
jgi:hypothetical protein